MPGQCRLHCDLGEHVGRVMADPSRLQQVLWNVVKNAAKFTPEGGNIFIRTRRADARVRIEVQDTGPGLGEHDLQRVFERFYRADKSRARASGGVGLGLSIVAAVAEAHGGRVAVRSGPSGGATFRITLPLLRQTDNSHRTPRAFSAAVASMGSTSTKGGA